VATARKLMVFSVLLIILEDNIYYRILQDVCTPSIVSAGAASGNEAPLVIDKNRPANSDHPQNERLFDEETRKGDTAILRTS
jgi:hypothetical protein